MKQLVASFWACAYGSKQQLLRHKHEFTEVWGSAHSHFTVLADTEGGGAFLFAKSSSFDIGIKDAPVTHYCCPSNTLFKEVNAEDSGLDSE